MAAMSPDVLNALTALVVFAAIVGPFAWWTLWRHRRDAKLRDSREQRLQRLRSWD